MSKLEKNQDVSNVDLVKSLPKASLCKEPFFDEDLDEIFAVRKDLQDRLDSLVIGDYFFDISSEDVYLNTINAQNEREVVCDLWSINLDRCIVDKIDFITMFDDKILAKLILFYPNAGNIVSHIERIKKERCKLYEEDQ